MMLSFDLPTVIFSLLFLNQMPSPRHKWLWLSIKILLCDGIQVHIKIIWLLTSVLKTKLKNGDKFVLTFLDCGNVPVFVFENPRGTLYTLKISDTVLMARLPYEFTSCEVYLNSSWFLGCNGERLQQDQYIRKMKAIDCSPDFFRACPFRHIQIPIFDLVNSILQRILVLTEYETGQTIKGYIPLHKFNRNSLLSLFIHSAPTLTTIRITDHKIIHGIIA